ncbi:MAG: amidase [Burkholderiaceae bacterium]|nr:amidase [Burkholderiaceae bacterium]
MLPTVTELQEALDEGIVTSVELTRAALKRIDDPDGEGSTTFTKVFHAQAMAAAQASDLLRAAGLTRSPIDGLPISVKDLFDIAGEITTAGSVVLKDADPAEHSAVIVQRLMQAGAVIVGTTNMTEFAFSGLGINPHYGTPRSPWERSTGHIPGGSSSGAGVSVADQMAVAAIGTDTGGSIRIPSAYCGITGFKPTAARIPSDGTLPLSFSLDSTGPLAPSVQCCAILDAVLAGEPYVRLHAPLLRQLRFAIPADVVLDDADQHVRQTFEDTIALLASAGAIIDTVDIPEFAQLPYLNRMGGLVCAEAWAMHRELLKDHAAAYDPRVSSRIMRGREQDAADYIELTQARQDWIAAVEDRIQHYDALLMPTTPIVAPTIAALQETDEAYFAANGLILRNPALINFLDGCALSLPCHPADTAPVGLMVAGAGGWDRHILEVGLAIEGLLAQR